MEDFGRAVTGATRVVFMIGTPIAQSQSPALFNPFFRAAGIDAVMVPLDVSVTALAPFVAMLRDAHNVAGLVATLPHKRALAGLVDEASETASALGSVNVVRRDADGSLHGDMSDGPGFWNAAAAHGFEPAARSMALAGGGAAGTAIAREFARRGGRRLSVWSKDSNEVDTLARTLAPLGLPVESGLPRSLAAFDIVVNATPLGMAHAPGSAFGSDLLATLPPEGLVADAVTEPAETQLLASARTLGRRAMPGREMTRGQFLHLARWLGFDADVR